MTKPPPFDQLPVRKPVYPLPLEPQPGLYRGKLVKGGPTVAIIITDIAGKRVAFVNHDYEIDAFRAWLSGADKPVDRETYLRLVGVGSTPGTAHNSPGKSVDMMKMKPPTPKGTP